MSDSLQPHGLNSSWNSPGRDTGVGSRSLLQGIFLTQGSNPGLPHCRHILSQLSHQGTHMWEHDILKHDRFSGRMSLLHSLLPDLILIPLESCGDNSVIFA